MSIDQTPHYHATKYDSAAHEVIALLADETEGYGMREDSSGDVDSPTGWFALVTIPADVTFPSAPFDAYSYSADTVANEYGVTPADVIGTHIVFHDSHGFVTVATYLSEAAARETFDCLSAQYDVWSEDEWNDGDPLTDGDGGYVCPVPGHGYHSV